MIFNPDNIVKKEGSFTFSGKTLAKANACLNKEILKEFWTGHTFRTGELEIAETDEFVFCVGEAEILPLDGNLYSVNVTEKGIALNAQNETGLKNGFMALIDRIKFVGFDRKTLKIDCCEIKEKPIIKNRMIHFCIFPETELWELDRYIRLCGALRYSHIVLEFWGMLKLDTLKEMSWNCAFTKEQVKPLIQMAKDLGMEVIPMLNHWGHATGSRGGHGKHVVLDQNPALQNYFDDTGWCWSIENEETRELLRNLRNELMEVCGEGKYFHIGCDEAYSFDWSKESQETFCEYVNGVSAELKEQGRHAIMWGDMLICPDEKYNIKNHYSHLAPDKDASKFMLKNVSKDIIIADWQYWAKEAPVETAFAFKEAGFDVMLAPWDCSVPENHSCVETAKMDGIMGIMHTTWHTLTRGTPFITRVGFVGFEKDISQNGELAYIATYTAEKMRKVYFVNGDYEKAGWSKKQVGFFFD